MHTFSAGVVPPPDPAVCPDNDVATTSAPIDAANITLANVAVMPARADNTFWTTFGFDVFPLNPNAVECEGAPVAQDNTIGCRLPEGIIAFVADTAEANAAVSHLCQQIPNGPPFMITVDGCHRYLYRIAIVPTGLHLPKGVKVYRKGDLLQLPSLQDFTPDRYAVSTIHALPALDDGYLEFLNRPQPEPEVRNSALSRYSLRGRAAKYEEMAVEARPLLGDVCQIGQATVWYGPPNVGKTMIGLNLLDDAISQGRVTPGNVYYINADDSSMGFATKIRLMDDHGCHTLSPGQAGFVAGELASELVRMAKSSTARGTVVIIDTLKKFADLMAKREAAGFADACRQYVMQGGTVLAFAHTNKKSVAIG